MSRFERRKLLSLLSRARSGLQLLFFFFQAAGGIRDATVTGVQTCALPISPRSRAYVRLPPGQTMTEPATRSSDATTNPPRSQTSDLIGPYRARAGDDEYASPTPGTSRYARSTRPSSVVPLTPWPRPQPTASTGKTAMAAISRNMLSV